MELRRLYGEKWNWCVKRPGVLGESADSLRVVHDCSFIIKDLTIFSVLNNITSVLHLKVRISSMALRVPEQQIVHIKKLLELPDDKIEGFLSALVQAKPGFQ